jgi:RimJ/RimL family protein N-acetyltransferase
MAAMKPDLPAPVSLTVDRLNEAPDEDLQALCEAANAAIIDGGGFGWLKPPARSVIEQYFKGLLMVPDRELFVGRMDGVIYGAAQLVRPPRNNEAQSFGATVAHNFVAPYARGHGLARLILSRVEERARTLGFHVLNLDVRESQMAAIALYEAAGFTRWGTHPAYARVEGRRIAGHYYYKLLQTGE